MPTLTRTRAPTVAVALPSCFRPAVPVPTPVQREFQVWDRRSCNSLLARICAPVPQSPRLLLSGKTYSGLEPTRREW